MTRCKQRIAWTVWIACFALILTNGPSGCGEGSMDDGQGPAVSATAAAADAHPTAGPAAGKGRAALEEAAAAGEYLYALFHVSDDEETCAMRSLLEQALQHLEGKARICEIDVNDPAESGIVSRLGAAGAPMPLVLAVAPNGAVTGGFPQRVSTLELLGAMVGPRTAACLKALQDRKVVLACIQNDQTAHNEEAMRGVRDFMADVRFATLTESVQIDPRDLEEQKLLKGLKIDPETPEAVTVVMVPPGKALGQITGPTDKAAIEKVLRSRPTSCTPGGACCPR